VGVAVKIMLYTVPFNMLNGMPVISILVGLSSQHMPIGVQIIGILVDPVAVFKVACNFIKSRSQILSRRANGGSKIVR
jgi:Asp-tRNA(Asn)/Glu-tRNA(Gln) amidotransferase A subunit family amidase